MLTSIIGFILSIGIVVFIHEYGHYCIAKSFGVKILEFSIGFGKELYSRMDKRGTKWKLCLIPLGGFVKMYGDINPIGVNSATVEDEKLAFYTKPAYIRFLIVAAGPIANYLLTVVLLTFMYLVVGKVEIPAVINEVTQTSPAEKAGLLTGDRIISADGHIIHDFSELQRLVLIGNGQPMRLKVDRDGALIIITVIPTNKLNNADNHKKHQWYLGIINKQEPRVIKIGIIGSINESIKDVISISSMILRSIGQMLKGTRSSDELYGPLTIAKESGASLSHGVFSFIAFIAMISVNLGLINLLPIPVLDGGHLVLIAYEIIAKKAVGDYTKVMLVKMGFAILIFLIVISISNDIRSIVF